jgi:hypothetical protein
LAAQSRWKAAVSRCWAAYSGPGQLVAPVGGAVAILGQLVPGSGVAVALVGRLVLLVGDLLTIGEGSTGLASRRVVPAGAQVQVQPVGPDEAGLAWHALALTVAARWMTTVW